MDRDILRPGWPCFQSQRLGLSEEIPRWSCTAQDRGLDCSCDLECCYVLFVQFFGWVHDGLPNFLLSHVS